MSGQTVVVTGGTKGIGFGISTVFARNGARVLLVGRDRSEGTAAVDKIKSEYPDAAVEFVCGNVESQTDMLQAASTAVQHFGGIDVLCANAGIFPSVTIEKMTEKSWDMVMNVNLKGVFLALQACLPHLKKSGAGRVILTSSITGPITGDPGWSHYGASKAGMLGFMRTAALELAEHGITINAVLPGNILTPGLKVMGDEYLKRMATAVPLGRLGTVEDIGHAVYFLATGEAGYITGQTLVVDGGQILPESMMALAK